MKYEHTEKGGWRMEEVAEKYVKKEMSRLVKIGSGR